MTDGETRIEIGFQGGLILSLKLAPSEWAKLEAGLAAGDDRVAVEGEDATTHIQLGKICYVKHEPYVGRIGF